MISDDIVKRLHFIARTDTDLLGYVAQKAADELQQLRAEIERLTKQNQEMSTRFVELLDKLEEGRRIVCLYPSERRNGALCGFPASAIVDAVRYEDDGTSTFFTLPMCPGHRLALGEHVITFKPVSGEGHRE